MNEDQTKGKFDQVAGKVTGDTSRENKGKLQEAVGDVKDAASKLVDKVTDKVADAKDNDTKR